MAALAGLALLAPACRPRDTAHVYRYKVTVEVDTPQGPRTASAVREIRWQDGAQISPEADMVGMTERGEAVMLELPDGQCLFALLSPDVQQTVNRAFGAGIENKLRARSEQRAVVLAPPRQPEARWGESGYPRLAKFSDINDPATVERVDPADLESSFGVGIRLRRITARMTDEPVTAHIDQRLKWLGDYRNKMLDGHQFSRTESQQLASHLNSLAFKRISE
jgi:hypothetical protein